MTEDGTGIKVPERVERKEEGRLGDVKGSREGAGVPCDGHHAFHSSMAFRMKSAHSMHYSPFGCLLGAKSTRIRCMGGICALTLTSLSCLHASWFLILSSDSNTTTTGARLQIRG